MFNFLRNFMRAVYTPVWDSRLVQPAAQAGVEATTAGQEEVSYEHLLPYLMLPLISTF
jgi:hypothetical protein